MAIRGLTLNDILYIRMSAVYVRYNNTMTSSGDVVYPIQGRQNDNGEDESCDCRRRSKVHHKEKPLIDQTECAAQGHVRRTQRLYPLNAINANKNVLIYNLNIVLIRQSIYKI
jgi:hypothetical protein